MMAEQTEARESDESIVAQRRQRVIEAARLFKLASAMHDTVSGQRRQKDWKRRDYWATEQNRTKDALFQAVDALTAVAPTNVDSDNLQDAMSERRPGPSAEDVATAVRQLQDELERTGPAIIRALEETDDGEGSPSCGECGDADSVLNEQCLCPYCAARDAYQIGLLRPAVDAEYAGGGSIDEELPF